MTLRALIHKLSANAGKVGGDAQVTFCQGKDRLPLHSICVRGGEVRISLKNTPKFPLTSGEGSHGVNLLE
jgi:hypothetical protein